MGERRGVDEDEEDDARRRRGECDGRRRQGRVPPQLAIGNAASIGDAAGEMGTVGDVGLPGGGTAQAVSAGQSHTCARS
jgi:hypothetical protein